MDRTAQIEALAEDYLRNLAAGTARAVEEVIAAHPALMPELNEALAQMIRLHRARQAADQAEEPRDEIPPTASGDSLAAEEASLRARVADSGSRTVEDWIPGYRIHVPGARDSRLVGGQGSVYKAIQLTTNRRVAIKILNRHTDASARKRFEREIDLIRKFKHPHIVTIFDAGKTRLGQPYYVMELVEHALHLDDYVHGRDADGQVVREKLSLEATLELFRQVCDAVLYAHQKGVIHRDLKPANILVQQEPYKSKDGATTLRPAIKVVDFGLAKSETSDSVSLESRALIGTLHYMAPEQVEVRSELIDTRSDLYALGVILYE